MVDSSSLPDPQEGTRVYDYFYQIEDGHPVRPAQEVLSWRTDNGDRPSDEWLAASGYYGWIRTNPPDYDKRTQKIVQDDPWDWLVDDTTGTVTNTWKVLALTQEELAEEEARAWDRLRTRRLQLLLLTDYTQGLDFTGDRQAWATYRQELRDLPGNTADPFAPNWPTEPS